LKTRIKELRVRHNLTQAQLAKRVGVRRETIIFVEKCKYNPSLMLAKKISVALESGIEDVFIFDDDEVRLEK